MMQGTAGVRDDRFFHESCDTRGELWAFVDVQEQRPSVGAVI